MNRLVTDPSQGAVADPSAQARLLAVQIARDGIRNVLADCYPLTGLLPAAGRWRGAASTAFASRVRELGARADAAIAALNIADAGLAVVGAVAGAER